MAGAAALAAESALRAGAGYAVVVCPGALVSAITAALPSAVLRPYGDEAQSELEEGALEEILEQPSDAVVIGPGLGTDPATVSLIRGVYERLSGPLVVDADALNLSVDLLDLLRARNSPTLLTPHPGEAARLLGWDGPARVQADRPASLEKLIDAADCTVLLKGANTLVGDENGMRYNNLSGNSGMATAGSGDVLSGLIGALLARGHDLGDAARLGAHLHGRAGDLAAAELGEESLIASDLIRFLPAALQEHPKAS